MSSANLLYSLHDKFYILYYMNESDNHHGTDVTGTKRELVVRLSVRAGEW